MGVGLLSATARKSLVEWFRRCGRDLPWRKSRDPYAIAVSEFMLQQTRVSAVLDFYLRWMEKFPTVQELAAASEHDVLSLWQGLGYYSRARNLHRLARCVVENHGGIFPRDPGLLRALPGVGEYTASAICAFAFDQAAPVIDANVARVLARWSDCRLPVDSAAGRDFLRELASDLQPDEAAGFGPCEWNSAVMELGALLCTSGRPDCLLCPVRSECLAGDPSALPVKKPRASTTAIEENRALILHRRRLWLEKSGGPRWRGLWILPELCNGIADGVQPLCKMVYPITRYRVTMNVILLRSVPQSLREKLEPHDLKEWEALPLAAPHRRAVAHGLELVHSAGHA
jgi:A/G-specific adenine glycosylase